MALTPRQSAVRSVASGSLRPGPSPAHSTPLSDLYGTHVFDASVQRKRLPKDVYRALRRTIETGSALEPGVADAVANAMKDWAIEHGATHYTHWFQPLTGLTAEKHDSFLSPTIEGGAILEFSGKELIQGEPDASSFPSGGLRATFEARGYTAWDPTSPAFLRETAFGSTLTIPTAFASWTGEALDTKTPLLRSCEALDREARRVLSLLGDADVKRVRPTVGPEQEYFLIDREFYYLRPDLISCGRTLFGDRPPKGQELDDHYFGATPQRVLAFMMDLEHELWRLGIPVKTRHAEVAPSQFELAPVYEEASVATDHNMLTMELLGVVAERHGLKCLIHEKPFARVNGSGKHNNWSMADDRGNNLLEPGDTPHENQVFIVALTAIIRAVDRHQDLLRAAIASAGNDHRLGANEAPPAIISIFLGNELEGIVEGLIQGTGPTRDSGRGQSLKLGVNALPPLPRDTSDCNRTSPFAFTGTKFEFRALGSSQTIAYPNTFLNVAVAEALGSIADELEKRGTDAATVQDVVREILTEHQRILFSGDNYTQEWQDEAAKRGLLNLRDTPSALGTLNSEKNAALFDRYGVFSKREVESLSNVLHESYAHRLVVEALSMRNLAATSILPAALAQQERLASSIQSAYSAGGEALELNPQHRMLSALCKTISAFQTATLKLDEVQTSIAESDDSPEQQAQRIRAELIPAMDELRELGDQLERDVADDLWPLPKYREMLFMQ